MEKKKTETSEIRQAGLARVGCSCHELRNPSPRSDTTQIIHGNAQEMAKRMD